MVNERRSGCFWGYRVNCEYVPCLPARVVADCLVDPRQIPYLLIGVVERFGMKERRTWRLRPSSRGKPCDSRQFLSARTQHPGCKSNDKTEPELAFG